jgi:antitoxin (DNA-binding transcriptional repressor) of toxin-antitoxin stability system
MTKVSATEAARQFSDIMNRVKFQGQSFEVMRGNEAVARIVPAGPSSPVQVKDLNAFFRNLPSLDSGDLDNFEQDLAMIRSQAGTEDRNEWD